jgi:hypothetical protein
MVTSLHRVLVLLMVVLAMTGCAHHSVVVRCDGKLEPINLPQPKAADMMPAAPASPPADSTK